MAVCRKALATIGDRRHLVCLEVQSPVLQSLEIDLCLDWSPMNEGPMSDYSGSAAVKHSGSAAVKHEAEEKGKHG